MAESGRTCGSHATRMRPVTALALTSSTPGFARQRAIDQPGTGRAVHAIGQQRDLAAAGNIARMQREHILIVPGRKISVAGNGPASTVAAQSAAA